MRDYEIVYIFRPTLESEEVDAKLEGFHGRLDGEITAVEHWGKRQLAYEIAGERNGYYVVAQFRADPSALSGFEQALQHDEELIRHLVVLSEGEMPLPPSQRRGEEEEAAGDDGGGQDEDEDEEEEGEAEVDEEEEDEEDEEDDDEEEADGDGASGDDTEDDEEK